MWIDSKELPSPGHILIVDDEPDHLSLMSNLLKSRYHVACATTAQQALDLSRHRIFHLGIVDVRLPDLSGLQLVSRLREVDRQMGFVLITAYPDIQHIVRAVRDLGVIDYLAKPFQGTGFLHCIDDAMARIHASFHVVLNDLAICLKSNCVWQADQLLPLSSQEFDLLAYLACRPGFVVTYEQLFDELWSCDPADLPMDMLWNLMKRLRAKLGDDPNNPRYIRTIRGIGYQAVGPASEGQALRD